jgi:hypothetical protein
VSRLQRPRRAGPRLQRGVHRRNPAPGAAQAQWSTPLRARHRPTAAACARPAPAAAARGAARRGASAPPRRGGLRDRHGSWQLTESALGAGRRTVAVTKRTLARVCSNDTRMRARRASFPHPSHKVKTGDLLCVVPRRVGSRAAPCQVNPVTGPTPLFGLRSPNSSKGAAQAPLQARGIGMQAPATLAAGVNRQVKLGALCPSPRCTMHSPHAPHSVRALASTAQEVRQLDRPALGLGRFGGARPAALVAAARRAAVAAVAAAAATAAAAPPALFAVLLALQGVERYQKAVSVLCECSKPALLPPIAQRIRHCLSQWLTFLLFLSLLDFFFFFLSLLFGRSLLLLLPAGARVGRHDCDDASQQAAPAAKGKCSGKCRRKRIGKCIGKCRGKP